MVRNQYVCYQLLFLTFERVLCPYPVVKKTPEFGRLLDRRHFARQSSAENNKHDTDSTHCRLRLPCSQLRNADSAHNQCVALVTDNTRYRQHS